MWRLSGGLSIQLNFPKLSNIGNSVNEHGGLQEHAGLQEYAGLQGHGGVRGERLKKLEEFFYPLSLKDEVFKNERQFPPPFKRI